MSTGAIVSLVIIVILLIAIVALYFVGKKTQKKQEEQAALMESSKQTVSMLIIDKKRMKLKDSGLPQAVIAQTPKIARSAKMPIVKAKVGPQILSLVCDEKIFDKIPVKKEVKASVSGIYIIDVKGIRGNKTAEPEVKKNAFQRAWAAAKQKAGVTQVK